MWRKNTPIRRKQPAGQSCTKRRLLNLFSNCIRYNKPGGAIYTTCGSWNTPTDTVTRVFIRDTGVRHDPGLSTTTCLRHSQGDNAARSSTAARGWACPSWRSWLKKR